MSDALSAGTVSLTVRPDTRDFSKLLKGALNGESANLQTMGQKLGKNLAEGMTVALAAIGAIAIKSAVDFSSATAKIQGAAQLTTQQATAIGDAFLHTAGQSTFSGKAMADAFGPVAGVIQTLTGHTLTQADALTTMKVATTLAEASQGDLKSTTASLAAVMQAFHIGLSGASDASNVLFNASRVTGISLDEMSSATVKLHGRLGVAAPSLQDMSALIVDLAQHGLTGSRSLRLLNSGMTTLLGGSKATGTELARLNMHVYDSSGKFVGMQSVLEQLTPKLAGMTEQNRLMAEKMLFGAGAGKALDATIMAGAAGLAKATAAATAKNAVDKAAQALLDSTKGKLEKLTATWADFLTMLGQKIIPIIEKTVTWMINHKAIVIGVAAVIGGVMLLAMGLWIASLVSTTVALLSTATALAILTSPIWLIVAAIAGFVAALIWSYKNVKVFHDGVNAAVNGVLKGFQYMTNGIFAAINLLIRAWNLVPWHKDIKTLTNVEFPQLANAAESAARRVHAALTDMQGHHDSSGPSGGTTPKAAAIKASTPSMPDYIPAASSSIPDFSGAVTALTGAKKALSEHAKIAAKLVADHLKATKIYGQMNTVIKDALLQKTDLIKAAGIRDAADQATFNDASFHLTRTFNDDKFKLDRDYQDQKDKLNRSYNDSLQAAQKTYDDADVADKAKHLDALKQLEITYDDKVTQLTQAAATQRQSIVQKSIDLLTGAFSSATSVDVGKLFNPATGVSGMLDVLKTHLTGATDLAANAAKLSAQGYSQTFIQQVVSQGPDIGNSMADAILAATPEAASQMKDLFAQINNVSDNGVTQLATSMNSGAKLATQALMDEYAKVGTDLQVSLATEYAAFTDANAKENASYTATMAASLKTLTDAKAAALLTLTQGLADAATSYNNSLFDMNTTLNNGLFDAHKILSDALTASATQFNTDMDNLQTSTMAKMAALMTNLQAVANAIAKISGASAGAAVITGAPKLPTLVTPSTGSLDSASAAARAAAVSPNLNGWNGTNAYNSQVPAAARVIVQAPITVDGSTAPADIAAAVMSAAKFGGSVAR